MDNNLDDISKVKIVISDSLRNKISDIINQERDENEIKDILLQYEFNKMNQNNCYQNEVCYKCYYIFEWCL